MRPAKQQYLYAQQQQQGLLNSGFSPRQQQQQQQQQQSSNPAAFLPPHYAAQLAALNGLQVLGGGGMAMGGAMAGVHRGILPMQQQQQQNGLLQQQQWAHLRPDSQAWGSGVFPSSQQGLIQANLVQQHVQQQQVAYLQDLRSGSVGLNGVPIPQFHHGGDGLCGGQQWAHPHDRGKGQYGAASMPQDSRRAQDGMRRAEFSRGGGSHGGGGHSHGNGKSHNKPYNKNDRTPGNWARGGGGGGGGGDPATNPRFKGGRNERVGRAEEQVRSQQAEGFSLRCDACDRTFKNSQQFVAHNNTHIKCDVKGCSFEASGRVVKEHKQSAHDSSASDVQVRAKSSKSKESAEEIARWIEERKKNYPTAKNIKHKAEEMKAKKLRGELVDEDARKRRERLKEILAKQAELGVPVAEVPAYYMSDKYGSLKGKGAKGESSGSGPSENHKNAKRGHDSGHHLPNGATVKDKDKEPPSKVPRISDEPNGSAEPSLRAIEMEVETIKETNVTVEGKEDLETAPDDDKDQKGCGKTSEKLCFFYKRGRCKKGTRCEYLHERRSKKKKKDEGLTQPPQKRAPTLLAKLLESDVRREKSHLLQAFRFFVNNMFLLEFPEKPLKFFEWQETNDRNSDAEIGRPDTEAQEIEIGDGGGSDEDAETSQAEEESEEVTILDGEAQEVESVDLLDSDGETHHNAEDGVGTDEDMDALQEEENRSEVVTRSDEEDMDYSLAFCDLPIKIS